MVDKKINIMFDIGEYNPKIIDFLTLLDITSKSKASDEEIEELAEDIKQKWWEDNKESFAERIPGKLISSQANYPLLFFLCFLCVLWACF